MKKIIRQYYQRARVYVFDALSTLQYEGHPLINQPVLFNGQGSIRFGDNVSLGYFPSPYFYDGSIYIEARNKGAQITFGSNIYVNNNLVIICDRTSITIEDDVLIGTNVEIIDSDFHGISPAERNSGKHKCASVRIMQNVFIGSNSKIMKGVTIGKNSIIGNGSIVTGDIPENVIASGNPATVRKAIVIA